MKKILTLAIALVAITSLVHSADKAYVINHCPVTPVREEPSEAAEQATQLLFGDVCEVVETRSSRIKIRSLMDGQVGWITTKMTTAVSEEEAMKQLSDEAKGVVVTPMAVATVIETGEQLMLTIGTRLPNYANGRFEMLGKRYKIDAKCVRSLEAMRREATRREAGSNYAERINAAEMIPKIFGNERVISSIEFKQKVRRLIPELAAESSYLQFLREAYNLHLIQKHTTENKENFYELCQPISNSQERGVPSLF